MPRPTNTEIRRQHAAGEHDLSAPAAIFFWLVLVNAVMWLRGIPADVRAARYHQPRLGNLGVWRSPRTWMKLLVLCVPYFVGCWIYYKLRWHSAHGSDCAPEIVVKKAAICPVPGLAGLEHGERGSEYRGQGII